jgi:glutamine synthetase
MQDKEYILEQAKAYDVKFVRLWFTDILGYLKGFAITVGELEQALEEGMGFDGSSIEGFARIDESDMVAMPDMDTFTLLPWRPKEGGSVARMFCDIKTPEGKPCVTDPRYILKRQLDRAAKLGFTFYVGPELEYFYFKSPEGKPEVLDHGGYFDLIPHDEAVDLRRETVLTLEEMGIAVEYSHHEVAPSQHEIDLRYCDALTMADNAMTYRLVVKEIALKNDCYATFMPKPLFGENGSGMHTHQSLFAGDRNAFFDANGKSYLSEIACQYIAGLMQHAPEITLITNQWVNSYKRLVPGYEAPVYVSWGQKNRSDLVRVPIYKPGRENATRIEYRSPDPACNPYLAFAAMLAAGLEGIEKKYPCPNPTDENVYKMGDERRKELGINTLPRDLAHATELAENSTLLKDCLGADFHAKLIENKRIEWDKYRIQVTEYELDNYLPVL